MTRLEAALEQPTRIKHYEILSRLGEGGMGVVYRARDTRIGRNVALKMLHGRLAADEERSRRFEREARIVSAISHPGIATLYEFDHEGDTAYLAMELIEGPSLRELLRQGPLPLEQVLDCAVQVAEALGAAHREGVIHRDLKPENVMVATSGYFKVLDFGVARIDELTRPRADATPTQIETVSFATSSGGLVGTVAYMSPEQALAEPLDVRSDIFAFGSLLYEAATGRPAFRGNNVIATAEAIVHRQPEPMRELRPELPLGLELITNKCLAKKPEDRYQSIEQLLEDLRTLQFSSLTGSQLHRRLLAHRDVARRRRWIWAVAAVAGLALIGVIVMTLALRQRSAPGPASAGPATAGPASAAAQPAAFSGKPRIVVAFFENQTGDPQADWLTRGLPEMLTTDLSRAGDMEVIATQRLYDLAATASGGESRQLDRGSATELARWAGATVMISGAVFKLGETYRIDAQAYDTGGGTVLVAHKVEGTDLFSLVNELTDGVRQGLSLAGAGKGEAPGLTTSSEEAFKLYASAKELYDSLRFEQAAKQLDRALELDPDFTLARLQLMLSRYSQGDDDAAVAQLERLDAETGRLPDKERLLVQAFDAILRQRDLASGTAHLQQLVERAPDDSLAYVLWARALNELARDPLEAMGMLRQAIEHDPNDLIAILALTDQLARLGQTEAVTSILRETAARHPQAAEPLERMIDAYAAEGRQQPQG